MGNKHIEVSEKTHAMAKEKAKKAGVTMKKYVELAIVMASTNVNLAKAK